MAEDNKSALHDATPSWNGFNYQGKVGLYVCLKMIFDKCHAIVLESKEFTDFLESFSIEFEWIEDFSIKNNKQYVSLHQVKHNCGTGFSDYISAIVTILNRKSGRLSETDFVKYVDLDIDFKDCNTIEEKNLKKVSEIYAKFELLRKASYIDNENKISPRWREIKEEIEGVKEYELQMLLTEFEAFVERTFENSKVYFHTSENISIPSKDINKYQGVPDYHHNEVNGRKSLSDLGIYLGFDDQKDYTLTLSDKDLNVAIESLVSQLLNLTLPDENFSAGDISIYQAGLCQIIDQHIVARHKAIRGNANLGMGFEEKRESIKFSSFFALLTKLVQQQDDEYWESFCALCFEKAYTYEVQRLECHIKNNINIQENYDRKNNLEKYRQVVIQKYRYSELLPMLSPNKIKTPPLVDYYHNVSNEYSLINVFLKFIRAINKEPDDVIIKSKCSLVFHPSAISILSDDACDREYDLQRIKHQITNNEQLSSLAKVTHLVVGAHPEHDLSNESVELLSIVETIEEEMINSIGNSANNVITVKFASVDSAIGTIK